MHPLEVHKLCTWLLASWMILSFSLVLCFVSLDIFYLTIKYLLQFSSQRISMQNCSKVSQQPSKVQSSSHISQHSLQGQAATSHAESNISSSNYFCHMSLMAAFPLSYIQSKQELVVQLPHIPWPLSWWEDIPLLSHQSTLKAAMKSKSSHSL